MRSPSAAGPGSSPACHSGPDMTASTSPDDASARPLDPESRCPCGSGDTFGGCCRPILGGRPAPTAETLMRSRFTAFAVHDEQHLLRTWHPDTRPARVELDPELRWNRLDIHGTTGGGPFEEWGTVDFSAHYRTRPGAESPLKGQQRENSRFRRVDGHWLYLDGALYSA